MHRRASASGPLRVLASRKGFGSVSRCPSGCYHVTLPNLSFRVSGPEYRMLLELLADSAERTQPAETVTTH